MTCLCFALKPVIILLSETADDSISRGLILQLAYFILLLLLLYMFEAPSQGSPEEGDCQCVIFPADVSYNLYNLSAAIDPHRDVFLKRINPLLEELLWILLPFFFFLWKTDYDRQSAWVTNGRASIGDW